MKKKRDERSSFCRVRNSMISILSATGTEMLSGILLG